MTTLTEIMAERQADCHHPLFQTNGWGHARQQACIRCGLRIPRPQHHVELPGGGAGTVAFDAKTGFGSVGGSRDGAAELALANGQTVSCTCGARFRIGPAGMSRGRGQATVWLTRVEED